MWWVPEEDTDTALDSIAYGGLALSAILVVLGAGNVVIFTGLWILYHSLVNVGQRWYIQCCVHDKCCHVLHFSTNSPLC